MVEAPILEQWQPALPQPFRMINALLEELVDSAMLDALLARKHAPPIDEEGCLRVQGELAQVPCVASSRPLIAQLAEGVLLVASMASDAEGGGMDTEAAAGARPGNLSLWEQGQGLQQLLAFAGEPVTIASVPLHDKRKTRRVLLTTETALHALDVSSTSSRLRPAICESSSTHMPAARSPGSVAFRSNTSQKGSEAT